MFMNRNNLKVVAVNDNRIDVTNLFLEASGQRYFITAMRMSLPVYCLLRDGMWVDELARWDGKRRIGNSPIGFIRSGKMAHSVRHILDLVSDYVLYELDA